MRLNASVTVDRLWLCRSHNATVAVGTVPDGVAITPNGQFAYVTNLDSNNVSVIQTSSNTVVATVPVGNGPQSVAIAPTVPFCDFNASLAIDEGRKPGFVLTSTFTLGSASTGLNPATEPMTLQIAKYTLTLLAGSFHQLWNAPNAPYGYEGTVNGATVVLGLIPLGKNTFAFDAAGSPVTFPGIKNPVTVTLTFGTDTGTANVQALITSY